MSPKAIVVQKQKDHFDKGEVIFKEGSSGSAMYIIKSGKVEVVKQTGDEEVVLATLEPKAFFGEMALFGDPHRSATIRAAADTDMIVITKEMLDTQFEKVPDWFVTILKTLIERLRDTNKRIKSRFPIGLEFSLVRLLYLHGNQEGESGPDGLLLPLSATEAKFAQILGVTKEQVSQRLKDMMFVGLVRIAIPKDQLLIPDTDRLRMFGSFLRQKAPGGHTGSYDSITIDNTAQAYFDKIYKLLTRRKG